MLIQRSPKVQQQLDNFHYSLGQAAAMLSKQAAATPVTVQALSGKLYKSSSGWILLSVPNALVRGVFDALNVPGAELPTKDGQLNAHISVIRPEELEAIGGADKISERGHDFSYTLGPVKEVEPHGWGEMSKVWFIEVQSPALRNLRKSYGLTGLPNNDKFQFHITIATRRKSVLRPNDIAKAAGDRTEDRLLAAFSAFHTPHEIFMKLGHTLDGMKLAAEKKDSLPVPPSAKPRPTLRDQPYQLLRDLSGKFRGRKRAPSGFGIGTPKTMMRRYGHVPA